NTIVCAMRFRYSRLPANAASPPPLPASGAANTTSGEINVTGISAIERAERLKSTLGAAPQRLLIDGRQVLSASGETFETLNPATGAVLARVAKGTTDDIDLAVSAARRAFENPAWRRMSANDRTNLLLRLADLIEKEADDLAVLECLDNGKPAHLTRLVEVEG